MLREHGHSPSEAFNETVEEATQSLYPLIAENGMDWMYANCSTTAQRGALDWFKAFRDATKPTFEKLYKSVADGEETKRVFRARVVNPRWISAMRRHGYKGAFELAATVDYLFGFDATAGVVDDWMYAQLAESYVFDKEVQDFMRTSNPWALRGVTERLLEAADRGLWSQPDETVLDQLRTVYLELEGQLEE